MPQRTCTQCRRSFWHAPSQFAPLRCDQCSGRATSIGTSGSPSRAPQTHITQHTRLVLKTMPSNINIHPDRNCAICFDNIDFGNECITPCGHVFHVKCIEIRFSTSRLRFPKTNVTCQMCRTPIQEDNLYQLPIFG